LFQDNAVRCNILANDQIGGAFAPLLPPGDVRGWDRYAYVNNSPMNFCDPSGHYKCSFENAEAESELKEKGWSSCEEFVDWTLSVLGEVDNLEVQLFLLNFQMMDLILPINFLFIAGSGDLEGTNDLLLGRFVKIPTETMIYKPSDQTSAHYYGNITIPYLTSIAHEMYHTTQPINTSGDTPSEKQAFEFQYHLALKLGLDWDTVDNINHPVRKYHDSLEALCTTYSFEYGVVGGYIHYGLSVIATTAIYGLLYGSKSMILNGGWVPYP